MERDKDGGKGGAFSRRDFLKTSAAGAVTAGLAAGSHVKAASANTGAVGPNAVPVTLRVDGQEKRLNLEPRVTLLDALRDHLAITGPKRVCDRGTCGACTVLMDGSLVYSCSVLAIEADGHEIETVASVGTPESLHPVQAAIVEHDGSQCGFCTPGFVMACKTLLDKNPHPSRKDIELGLGGNLCRCGTYIGLRSAIGEMTGEGGIKNG